jgi:MoaA/NifB/PqqE/SkfB family radical SAM enzyme
VTTDTPIQITAAGLLITDWCPAACRHCYVRASPEGSRWMSLEAAARHLAAFARMGVPGSGIHIGGGEPFGDVERLLAIVRCARDAGLSGVGYVETGGFWATSENLVRQRLAALRDGGMRQLAISADPYHQEFIPPERVRLLFDVARDVLGPGGVRVRRWKWLQHPEDVAAMPEQQRAALFADFLRRYPERPTGRAAERLAPLARRLPVERLPDEGCRNALLQSRHLHVDPDGWISPGTCAGIVLGRATADDPLDALLAAWRLSDSPRLTLLAGGGPRQLLPEAERLGFAVDPAGYAGKCHLCWMLRSHLVRAGAAGNEFEPAGLYGAS